mmetsp:Transcript_122455/g.346229  ORF Transcript_122455/g.346229 Transcript_122455/m.346229 type:complete len:221 (-) Transcript_122455:47-709(-)
MCSLMRPSLSRLGVSTRSIAAGADACTCAPRVVRLAGGGSPSLNTWTRPSATGKPAMRHLSNRADGKAHALVEQQKRAQMAAYVEGQRLRGQVQRVRGPFRESREGIQGAANVMALLLRPTSPSLFRLAAGLSFSTCSVVVGHWALHPMDPLCVLSLGFGAFAYVGVVGTSHSLLWYSVAAPLAMFVMLVFPGWQGYKASLEVGTAGQVPVRRRRDMTGF